MGTRVAVLAHGDPLLVLDSLPALTEDPTVTAEIAMGVWPRSLRQSHSRVTLLTDGPYAEPASREKDWVWEVERSWFSERRCY